MEQVSPPKPYQIRQSQAASTSNSSFRVSSAVANGRSIPTPPDGNTTSALTTTNSSVSSPSVPVRPGALTTTGRYGSSYDSYGRGGIGGYGGYGSSALSSYGGSSYGRYGSYGNSSYGGYGNSSYGGYGSSYGGYGGSSYGGYGSGGYGSYGGYGGLNRYGSALPLGNTMGPRDGSYFQGAFTQISKFGQIAEGISMFSRLLDANFDAMHGTFGSIARLLEVLGELIYVFQTFAFVRFMSRFTNWMLGRSTIPARKLTGATSALVHVDDFKRFENRSSSQRSLSFFLFLGFTIIGIPMLLTRIWRKLKGRPGFEQLWNEDGVNDKPTLVRASHDFNGSAPEELSFRQNDIIKVTAQPFPEWWEGELNGRRGLFPRNYAEVMPLEPQPEQPPKNDVQ